MNLLNTSIKSALKRSFSKRYLNGSPQKSPSPLEQSFGALKQIGYDPNCLIDVGANRGNWSRTFLSFFPNSTVVMMEPQSWLRANVEDLLTSNPNLYWLTRGASNTEGEFLLTLRERDDSSNFLLSHEQATAQGFSQVPVQVTTVERVVTELSLPIPDIIKIDAEGLDLKVLEGCGSLVGKTNLFFIEASLLSNAVDNAFVRIVNEMKAKGYVLFDITDLNRSPNNSTLCLLELAFVKEGSWLQSQVSW